MKNNIQIKNKTVSYKKHSKIKFTDHWQISFNKKQDFWAEIELESDHVAAIQIENSSVKMAMLSNDGIKQKLIFKAIECSIIKVFSMAPAIKFKIIPQWLALTKIYFDVGRKEDNSYFKLAKISYARYKRVGMQQVEKKLLEAYHPAVFYNSKKSRVYECWSNLNNSIPSHINFKHEDVESKKYKTHREIFICVKYTNTEDWLETYKSIKNQESNYSIWITNAEDSQLESVLKHDNSIITNHEFCVDNIYIFIESGETLIEGAIESMNSILSIENLKKPASPEKMFYFDHVIKGYNTQNDELSFKTKFSYDHFLSRDYLGNAVLFTGELIIAVQNEFNNSFLQIHQSERTLQSIIYIAKIEAIDDSILHIAWPMATLKKENKYNKNLIQRLCYLRKKLIYIVEKLDCEIFPQDDFKFKVSYKFDFSSNENLISIIIPMKDKLSLTKSCVESVLEKTKFKKYEIIIVDNNSVLEETKLWLNEVSKNPKIRVLHYNYEFNYSAINNFAVRKTTTPLICLLNNDTEVINGDWLYEMIQHASRQRIGCVGAKLFYEDDTVQHGGVIVGMFGLAGHSHKGYHKTDDGYQSRLSVVQNYSAVTAACLVVRREVFEEAGALNEEHLPVAFNDVELCLKVQELGYDNLWTPYACLYHYESKSRGAEDTPEKKIRSEKEIKYMQDKWKKIISCEPYYNPNLTIRTEDFSIEIELPQRKLYVR